MPRRSPTAARTNGSVPRGNRAAAVADRGARPAERQVTMSADTPLGSPDFVGDPVGADDDLDPTAGAMAASNALDLGAPAAPPLEGFTGSASGAVGRPTMVPQTIEALGPNGEVLTLERGEDGMFRTLHTNDPPPPVSAHTDHPLLQQLRSRTNKPKGQVQRAPAYNHRMLWYMKDDGEIVPLQGDPGNRAYYEDKGYVVLRPEEERLYLRGDPERNFPPIRRLVIAEQRKRASLITVIRNIAQRNPSVELTGDLSITPTEELEQLLVQLRGTQGINFRLLEARQRTTADVDERDDKVLDGVEILGGQEVMRKMARAREQEQIGGLNRRPATGPVELATTGQLMPGAGD